MFPFSRKKKTDEESDVPTPTPEPAALAAMIGAVKSEKENKEEAKAAANYPGRRKESVALINKGATKSEAGIWRFQIAHNRHCTDVLFLLLFIAFWVGMVVIGIIGFNKGDPRKLVLGVDYKGEVCGMDDKNYIYYPQLEEEMGDMLNIAQGGLADGFDGVCVKMCPLKGDTVMMRNESFKLRYDTKGLFFRCLVNYKTTELNIAQCYSWPRQNKPESAIEGTCTEYIKEWSNSSDDVEALVKQNCSATGGFRPLSCTKYADCKAKVYDLYPHCTEFMTGSTSMSEEPPGRNALFSQIMSAGAEAHRMIGDMEKSAGTAFVFGAVVAVFMGFVWTALVQVSAPAVVWGTVFLSMFAMSLTTLFFFAKGGVLGDTFSTSLVKTAASFTETNTADLAPWVAVDTEYMKHWKAAGYVFATVTLVLLCFILFFWSKIQKAIAIVREAGRAMRAMPLIAMFPIISIFFFVSVFLYSVVMVGYLTSMDTVEISPTTFTDIGGHLVNATTAIQIEHKQMKFMLCYHLMGFLWTTEVISGIEMVTIAGAVSSYYWRPPQLVANADAGETSRLWRCIHATRSCTTSAVTRSLWRALRYHLGSICFGGLVLTIANMIRIAVEYMLKKMKGNEENSSVVKVVASCLRCLTWMLKEVLNFISDQAYIVVAMQGVSFCSAVKEAYTLLKGQLTQLIAVQIVAKFVLILGKAFIVVTCTALMFLQLDSGGTNIPFAPGGVPSKLASGDQAGTGLLRGAANVSIGDDGTSKMRHALDNTPSTDTDAISDPTMPMLLVLLLSYLVASSFMNTFRIAIETLFLCFAADSAMNDPPIFDLTSRALEAEMKVEEAVAETNSPAPAVPVKLDSTGKALEGVAKVAGPPAAAATKAAEASSARSRPVRKKKPSPAVNPVTEFDA
jgi:choline transporter-like protein 2/4/5